MTFPLKSGLINPLISSLLHVLQGTFNDCNLSNISWYCLYEQYMGMRETVQPAKSSTKGTKGMLSSASYEPIWTNFKAPHVQFCSGSFQGHSFLKLKVCYVGFQFTTETLDCQQFTSICKASWLNFKSNFQSTRQSPDDLWRHLA